MPQSCQEHGDCGTGKRWSVRVQSSDTPARSGDRGLDNWSKDKAIVDLSGHS